MSESHPPPPINGSPSWKPQGRSCCWNRGSPIARSPLSRAPSSTSPTPACSARCSTSARRMPCASRRRRGRGGGIFFLAPRALGGGAGGESRLRARRGGQVAHRRRRGGLPGAKQLSSRGRVPGAVGGGFEVSGSGNLETFAKPHSALSSGNWRVTLRKSLERAFPLQKRLTKVPDDRYLTRLSPEINGLRWSDPVIAS